MATRSQRRCFLVNIAKFLRTDFFIEHLRWLLLQVLYKKVVPKNFADFTRTFRYPSPFLSSCRTHNLQLCKNRGSVTAVFAVNFLKFLRTISCRITLNGCSWTLRGDAGNRYSRNYSKFTAKALRSKCSGNRFWCLMTFTL